VIVSVNNTTVGGNAVDVVVVSTEIFWYLD
jgi:hypothetical protein